MNARWLVVAITLLASPAFADDAFKQENGNELDVVLGEPSVVAVGRPQDTMWGMYQFPSLFRLADGRMGLSYHVHADSVVSYGKKNPNCVSSDGGVTWTPVDYDKIEPAGTGLFLRDGTEVKLQGYGKTTKASNVRLPEFHVSHTDMYTRKVDFYRLGDLPDAIRTASVWYRDKQATEWRRSNARIDIPELAVPVFRREWAGNKRWVDPNLMVIPGLRSYMNFVTITPEDVILSVMAVMLFKDKQHLAQRNAIAVVASQDRGTTWRRWGTAGYFTDDAAAKAAAQVYLNDPASNYNRLWGGPAQAPVPNFSSNGFAEPNGVAFGNGRMFCVMRTDSGNTHSPMFIARSKDWGKTWTVPEILTPFGVKPQFITLDDGTVAMIYGRPGLQLLFCTDGTGERWHDPLNFLPDKGEKTRQSRGHRGAKTDTCGNCTVLKTGPDRFLVAYSDFRHTNAAGQMCKAIKVREVVVRRRAGPAQSRN